MKKIYAALLAIASIGAMEKESKTYDYETIPFEF